MIHVRKPWTTDLGNEERWYHMTRWCVTELGIPGDTRNWNYVTETDYMDLYFRDPRDAELFILKWM